MTDHLSPARPGLDLGWRHAFESQCQKISVAIGGETHAYQLGGIRVLSSREMAEYQGVVCPHNHVSVSVDSCFSHRPTDADMAKVRAAFDMEDAEEDNHQPGRIRNLFLPLHLPRGTTGVCDCKSDETVVTELDGFQWSKPKANA